MNNKQGFSQWAAEVYYDFIDVNSNVERAEWIARAVPNGGQSALNFFVMLLIIWPISILAAWHFDFHSTYAGLQLFITQLLSSVTPLVSLVAKDQAQMIAWVAAITAIITFIVTVAPTAMELFTSNFARGDVLVAKVFVLGASIFDVVTDIPTTKAWIDLMAPSFESFGLLAPIIYYVFFFGWLALATVGFQLSVIIFGYVTYIYFIKWTKGMPISRYIPGANNGPRSNPQPTKVQPPVAKPNTAAPAQGKEVGNVHVVSKGAED
jgi:hypothetical protein